MGARWIWFSGTLRCCIAHLEFQSIYIYISSCPAGYLRHRAYCVLCFGVAKAHRRQTHEATKTTKNKHHKLTQNHEKLTPGGVPEAVGGGLGTISVPGGDPGCPRDARSRKSDEKFVHSSLLPCFLGTPKSYIFGIFSMFVVFLRDIFWKRFWKASGHHF